MFADFEISNDEHSMSLGLAKRRDFPVRPPREVKKVWYRGRCMHER